MGNITANVNGSNTDGAFTVRAVRLPPMLDQILKRIEQRLGELQISAADASRKAGLSADAIRNIRRSVEAGKIQGGISTKTADGLARVLKTSVSWLLTGTEAPPATPPTLPASAKRVPEISEAFVPAFAPRKIPILGRSVGGADGKFIMNGEKVGEVLAPASVEDVPEAYATWVYGTSMEPRYYAGEVVIVNPRVPIRQGNYVVVQLKSESDGDPPEGFVKRFVSHSLRELVLEQHNPPEGEENIIRYDAARVLSVHRIVATQEA